MNFEITNEMVTWFNKQIYTDQNNTKMTVDAKKACKIVGIYPHDLHEKTIQEFQYNLKGES